MITNGTKKVLKLEHSSSKPLNIAQILKKLSVVTLSNFLRIKKSNIFLIINIFPPFFCAELHFITKSAVSSTLFPITAPQKPEILAQKGQDLVLAHDPGGDPFRKFVLHPA